MKTITTHLQLERVTKNTILYSATNPEETDIKSIYVPKANFEGRAWPDAIVVTIVEAP